MNIPTILILSQADLLVVQICEEVMNVLSFACHRPQLSAAFSVATTNIDEHSGQWLVGGGGDPASVWFAYAL